MSPAWCTAHVNNDSVSAPPLLSACQQCITPFSLAYTVCIVGGSVLQAGRNVVVVVVGGGVQVEGCSGSTCSPQQRTSCSVSHQVYDTQAVIRFRRFRVLRVDHKKINHMYLV